MTCKIGIRHKAVKSTAVVSNGKCRNSFLCFLLRCTLKSRYTFWQHVVQWSCNFYWIGLHLNFKTSCYRNLRIGVLFWYVVRCGISWHSGASFTRYTWEFVALLDNPPSKKLVIKRRKGIILFWRLMIKQLQAYNFS